MGDRYILFIDIIILCHDTQQQTRDMTGTTNKRTGITAITDQWEE